MEHRQLELLSPAGSPEIFKHVIRAGADAVYFGGTDFGARAFAENFTMEEGKEAIAYAHLYGKKAYLTVNTLLKNNEMERKLYPYLKYYYESGLDAVIVQDPGVFSFVRYHFPGLAIHASTQMTVTQAAGAQFLYTQGASRIVAARELSIEELRAIHRQCPVEIEAFVHGALCFCYSGQCLMSSLIGGRSGNRGRCAQPCRLPYECLDERGRHLGTPGPYLLSLKDLCTIEDLPQLAEAGVCSFKIEGRMKQLPYATGVVSVYRKYMDLYLEHGSEGYLVSREDMAQLLAYGNRKGFTDYYLKGRNHRDMVTYDTPAHEQSAGTPVICRAPIAVRGTFVAEKGRPMELRVADDLGYEASAVGEKVQAAKNQAVTKEVVVEKLRKTGSTPFDFSELILHMDEDVFIPMGQLKELRRDALSRLEQQRRIAVSRDAVAYAPCPEVFGETKDGNGDGLKPCFVTITDRNQFEVAAAMPFVDTIGIPIAIALKDGESGYCARAAAAGKRLYFMFPPMFRAQAQRMLERSGIGRILASSDGVVVSSYDALGCLASYGFPKEKTILDHRLYTWSDRALRFFNDMGYRRHVAPLELNAKEFSHRQNRGDYLIVYGRSVVMVTANCLWHYMSKEHKRERICYLKDRKQNEFPVKNHCAFCYNEIYNSRITCLFDESESIRRMGFYGYRLDLTMESPKESRKVLLDFEQSFYQSKPVALSKDATKGHWKRGVK